MKKYLIYGYGLSGKAAERLLKAKGRKYQIVDDSNPIQTRTAIAWNDFHTVVVSPGVPPHHQEIQKAKEFGVRIITEFDLALDFYVPDNLFLVTGTNGKSSICQMIHHILNKVSIKNELHGNIGNPCSDFVNIKPKTVVIELSSYHLYYAEKIPKAVGVLCNISDDHLDWHLSKENYFRAKWRLIENCISQKTGYFIDDSVYLYAKNINLQMPDDISSHIVSSGLNLLPVQLKAWPKHQKQNAFFAAKAIQQLFSFEITELLQQLVDYKHLPYRFQIALNADGGRIINDSKSTNIHSTIAALSSLEAGEEFLLLLGGVGKDEDFSVIKNYIQQNRLNVKKIYCFGKDGKKIQNSLTGLDTVLFTSFFEMLPNVEKQYKSTKCSVLFSPGCASFDEFKNYSDRGEHFDKWKNNLLML